MAAVKGKVEWLAGDDRDWERFSRRLRIWTLCSSSLLREPEDVFSILSELALDVHWHQSGQELNPCCKMGNASE